MTNMFIEEYKYRIRFMSRDQVAQFAIDALRYEERLEANGVQDKGDILRDIRKQFFIIADYITAFPLDVLHILAKRILQDVRFAQIHLC